MQSKNFLSEKIQQEIKKQRKNDAGIREANISFFITLLISAALFPLSYLVMKNSAFELSIALAILSFVVMIFLGLFAYSVKSNNVLRKNLYYLSYFFAALSVSFSFCAMATYLGGEYLTQSLVSAAVLIVFALADLLVLSVGKAERSFVLLLTVLSVVPLIAGIVLMTESNPYGVVLLFSGLSLFALQVSLTIYVFSGDSFYEILALSYVILALLAFVIALLIILQADSCDCDCAPDCSPSGGGRRKKPK